jgi:hypothetical protein
MFNPTYCKHNIRIATRFTIAYAVVILASFTLATILAWIAIHQFTWLALGFYLICLIIAKLATSQLRRTLRHRSLWKKYLADATTEPAPRVKRPACTASIFGSPTSN